MNRVLPVLFLCLCFLACSETEKEPIRIAFLADVHLTNIYGTLSDSEFRGIPHPSTGEHMLIRTMSAQLRSTRIFNENYFAFISALDDIAERGIKIVAFPGDYTDDGQPINIRGLKGILEEYEQKYNIQFLITTGNHDPVRPFTQDAGKRDFLGEGGKNQPIFSTPDAYVIHPETDHPVIVSGDVSELGYKDIITELGRFGYTAQREYLYWSTPFSEYEPATYSYEKGVLASALSNRVYAVKDGVLIPDATYLVEPIEGLWLVAIDGNIYIPKDDNEVVSNPANYKSPGLGYNNFSDNKAYFMNWLKEVSEQADDLGKIVIAFSHYPAVDFNDDASPILKNLLGESKWQLERVPAERIAKSFADAGINLHIAGHMHINDTGIRIYDDKSIVNIQTPSLAAYRPGYKILTLLEENRVLVETVTIDSVPGFNQLFPLYEMEYDFLLKTNDSAPWKRDVLESKNYHNFMLWHLKEVVRLRFINDWPEQIRNILLTEYIQDFTKSGKPALSSEIAQTSAYEMLLDMYKIRNADVLAFKDIPDERIEAYKKLHDTWKGVEPVTPLEIQIKQFFEVLNAFLNGEPADSFIIDFSTDELILAR
ncbi:MAG: metallophosphoesterase [Bacteroidota bacterium]